MTMPAALRLTLVVACIALVWGAVLPWIGRTGLVEGHVARMEERGVNPAAMYYTELERLPVRPDWIETRVVLWP
jgi:hypothetical protein